MYVVLHGVSSSDVMIVIFPTLMITPNTDTDPPCSCVACTFSLSVSYSCAHVEAPEDYICSWILFDQSITSCQPSSRTEDNAPTCSSCRGTLTNKHSVYYKRSESKSSAEVAWLHKVKYIPPEPPGTVEWSSKIFWPTPDLRAFSLISYINNGLVEELPNDTYVLQVLWIRRTAWKLKLLGEKKKTKRLRHLENEKPKRLEALVTLLASAVTSTRLSLKILCEIYL